MKYTVEIRKQTDGRLVADYRWTCEQRAPREQDDLEARDAGWSSQELRVPTIGATYMVATREYVGPPKGYDPQPDILYRPDDGLGWSGNSDRNICQYHGWRGTTDDWAVYGHGVRRCLAVRKSGKRSHRIVIIFGRDLKRHEV